MSNLLIMISVVTLVMTESKNSTVDPHENHYKKPTSKPVYKYPTKKPTNKYPSNKPIYKYPTKKPIYKYPTVKPICTSKNPTNAPTVNPSIIPSVTPTIGTSLSCFCETYNTQGIGPNVTLCYNNSTNPNEFYGVYDALDTTFTNNIITPNPNFPGISITPTCFGGSSFYDNKNPVSSNGVSWNIASQYYGMSLSNNQFSVYHCNPQALAFPSVAYFVQNENVACPSGNTEDVGSLLQTSSVENESKVTTVVVVVPVILGLFCLAIMYILYRKYKTSDAKKHMDDGLENFYTKHGNGENNHSKNPMETTSTSDCEM